MGTKDKNISVILFKANTKRIAKQNKISISNLCKDLGKNRSYLAHLKNPGITTIVSIAKVLQCQPAELLEGL